MISLNEAFSSLEELVASGSYTTKDLSALASQVPVVDLKAADDAVTHLYSKISINSVVDIDDTAVRIIPRTELAEFLQDDRFTDAVKQTFENAYPNMDNVAIKGLADDYLYGINTEGKTGPWADASRRFAAETKGEVIAHMGPGAEGRTMVNVELPEIMKNPNVTGFQLRPDPSVSQEEISRVTSRLESSSAIDERIKADMDEKVAGKHETGVSTYSDNGHGHDKTQEQSGAKNKEKGSLEKKPERSFKERSDAAKAKAELQNNNRQLPQMGHKGHER